MVYGFLIAAVISSGAASNVYKNISAKSDSAAMSGFFPTMWFLPLALFFGLRTVSSGTTAESVMKTELLLPAVIGGVGVAFAASNLIESMKHNTLSVSVIIVNMNFIIPVFLSMIFLKESAGLWQIFGILLSVAVIFVLNMKKDGGASGIKDALFLPCVSCVSNGVVNFCIKVYQNDNAAPDLNAFYTVMYLSGAVTCVLLWIMIGNAIKKKAEKSERSFSKASVDALMMCGCNGVYYYTAGLLAGKMNAAAQFTVITAASILVSLGIGVVFQKEKITKKAVFSFAACLVAIFCQASGI